MKIINQIIITRLLIIITILFSKPQDYHMFKNTKSTTRMFPNIMHKRKLKDLFVLHNNTSLEDFVICICRRLIKSIQSHQCKII